VSDILPRIYSWEYVRRELSTGKVIHLCKECDRQFGYIVEKKI